MFENLGIKVVPSPDIPKMRLSADVPVTPQFRAEIDAWMLGFFGTTNLIPDGVAYKIGRDILLVNPRTYASLKAMGGGQING